MPRGTLIACCGDSTPRVHGRISARLGSLNPDVIVFAGDARARGFGLSPRRARQWSRAWGGLLDRVVTIPGNHDYAHAGTPPWQWVGPTISGLDFRQRGNSAAFILSLADAVLLGLDSGPSAQHVSGDQLEWLISAMPQQDDRPRIAFVHSPLFPVSHHIGSSLDAHPVERDALWAALEEVGVTCVVSGHEHLYARRALHRSRQVTQIITGGAGAPLTQPIAADLAESAATHHFLLLQCSPSGVTGSAVELSGHVLDTFALHGC